MTAIASRARGQSQTQPVQSVAPREWGGPLQACKRTLQDPAERCCKDAPESPAVGASPHVTQPSIRARIAISAVLPKYQGVRCLYRRYKATNPVARLQDQRCKDGLQGSGGVR